MSAAGPAGARRPRAGRWFAGLVALAVAGATTVLLGGPAQAGATTYDAQLSMTGVATAASPAGGDTVGVHPGDSVKFSASATPTAGLANIPGIGSTLITLLNTLTGGTFQVVVTFDKGFPSVGGKTIKLGGPTSGTCGSKSAKSSITVRFPAKGSYGFHWTVKHLVVDPGLLGLGATCDRSNTLNDFTSTDLNQLKAAGIAINATNGWQGKVVSAKNPPKGGIGVQLPSVGASPSLPVVGKLPGVHLPGVTTPTLPGVGGVLPGSGTGSGGSGKGGAGGTYDYTPPVLTVPQMVVPNGGAGGGATNGYVVPQGQVEFGSGPHITGTDDAAGHGPMPAAAAAAHKQPATHLSASSTSAGGAKLPIVLAIIAIIALALVTATYARMHLLRRS